MAHCTAGPIRNHWSSHNQVLQLLVMLNIVTQNVVMLSVVMLNAVAPSWHPEKRSSLLRQKGFMTFGNKEKK
jgi:hypothetical protein